MLQEFLKKLCSEIDVSFAKTNEKKVYSFRLSNEIEANLTDLEPGVAMSAKIALCPEIRREDLFIFLMRANLLGQGTGGARIGIDGSDKFLTLSLGLPYEMNYQTFRETLEDFLNYLVYWREEVAKFEKEQTVL